MIDTSNWKEFRVGDLFEFESIKQAKSQRAVPDDINGIPYVVQSKYNNMVARYVNKQWLIDNNEPPVKGNTIALGVTLNCVSYQENEFGASQIITARNNNLNCYIGNFVATILTYATERFTYKEKPGLQKYKDTIIKLPATSDGQPDWDYMESYMKAVMEESEKSLESLRKADDTKHLIDVSGWGEFRVGDLFDVSRPSSRSSQNYDEGDMPFVASGNFNNGVTAYLQPKDDNDYDEGGCITVSAVDGYAFYQKDKFLGRGGAGSSIMMLRNDSLNELNGKYICTLIRKACNDWEYSNMGNKDKLADTIIWLPITSTGEPDWQYMEDYMKQIMDKSEQIVSDLQIGA